MEADHSTQELARHWCRSCVSDAPTARLEFSRNSFDATSLSHVVKASPIRNLSEEPQCYSSASFWVPTIRRLCSKTNSTFAASSERSPSGVIFSCKPQVLNVFWLLCPLAWKISQKKLVRGSVPSFADVLMFSFMFFYFYQLLPPGVHFPYLFKGKGIFIIFSLMF